MTYANDPLSRALAALADPTRRALYDDLRAKPRSVSDLAHGHPVSRPAVSQHLKVLEAADLVVVTPQGSHRIYAVQPDGLRAVRDYLDTVWDQALNSYSNEIKRIIQARKDKSDDPTH